MLDKLHGAEFSYKMSLSLAMKITCVLGHSTAANLIRWYVSTIVIVQASASIAMLKILEVRNANWAQNAVLAPAYTTRKHALSLRRTWVLCANRTTSSLARIV